MFTTAVIAFREFFEAFLIIGVFLGVSRKLGLRKEKEIGIAAIVGIILSFALAGGTYILGERARGVLTEKNADSLESYLLIFSGLFIAYVVLSLHKSMGKHRREMAERAQQKLERNMFDLSLFLTIVFMVVREGFEIALFTASTALFSVFMQNMLGLLAGFLSAAFAGIIVFAAYIKFPVGKVFKVTEYAIVLLGASLVQNGVTKLFETHFAIYLSNMLPVPMRFLPDEKSLAGHLLQSLLGVDRNFSIIRFLIMAVYIAIVYVFYMKQGAFKSTAVAAEK